MIHRRIPATGGVANGPDPIRRGVAMPGATPKTMANGWTPTVANLLVLVVLELAAFAALRYAFKVLAN